MAQQRIRSSDQRQIVARGEIRKKPRLSSPRKGGREYERVDGRSYTNGAGLGPIPTDYM